MQSSEQQQISAEDLLKQATAELLLHGRDQQLDKYRAERKSLGVTVYDVVHGSIHLGLLSSLLMKQPELERLGSLKQLGCSHKVFPNAIHNRLQHSVGVAHLAYTAGDVIAEQQEEDECEGRKHPQVTRFTPLDLELVEVAGLCHDLGHGPFSHAFESLVLPAQDINGWRHEALSSLLLRHMLERVFTELGLMEGDAQAQQEGQKLLEDVHRAVTDLIQADKQTDKPYSGHWKNKQFARQIVASSLDADKIDYLMRDMLKARVLPTSSTACRSLQELFPDAASRTQGYPNLQQLIKDSKLVDNQICFAAADQQLVQQLYRSRYLMHQHVYQHAAVKGFELMMADVLKLAAPKLSLKSWLEELLAATADPAATEDLLVELFLALRDSLLDEARHTVLRSIRAAREQKQDPSSDDLKARDILKRYDNGRSYSCVEEDDVDGCMSGHVWPQTSTQDDDDADGCLSEAKKKKKMSPTEAAAQAVIEALVSSSGVPLQAADIRVVYCKYDHCNKGKDPLELLWLWSEGEDGSLTKAKASRSPENRPESFITRKVRVYLTKLCSPEEENKHMDDLQRALRSVLAGLPAAVPGAAAEAAAEAAAAGAAAGMQLLSGESAGAAAGGLLSGEDFLSSQAEEASQQLFSSQAEEASQQLFTPAAPRPVRRRFSATPNSPLSSPAAETLRQQQQQEEEQTLPFCLPPELPLNQLQLGDGGGLNPSSSSSLDPAVSMGAASSDISSGVTPEAASARDVVDLTEAGQAGGQQQQQVKLSPADAKAAFAVILRPQRGEPMKTSKGPGRKATGSRPQGQQPSAKRAKHSGTKCSGTK